MMFDWKHELPKSSACSLREKAAITVLCNVRAQGHTYVELREDGKRVIFFCTLCLAPCYSDTVLFDHLKGNLHSERFATAKVTLLGSNPWPFNDGALFFDVSREYRTLSCTLDSNSFGCAENNGIASNGISEEDPDLVIPGILIEDKISELGVSFIGFGKISARFSEKGGKLVGISRIWGEWLGKKDLAEEELFAIPEHDYAIVTFSYTYELGRKSLLDDDVKLLLSSNENADTSRKRMKSFSEPEDVSGSFCSCSTELMCGQQSPSRSSHARDDEFFYERFRSKKSLRRELRQKQRLAAERICDICQHRMLPGRDVAALLNLETGKLACSSRNLNGVFHVFHISCLIHWILFCEFEIFKNQSSMPSSKGTQQPRKKGGRKINEGKKETKKMFVGGVFCPECQGTGLRIEENDDMENPTFPPFEMFKFKIRVSDAQRAWMKSPELLQNCSTGFLFPGNVEQAVQEKVVPVKLLHFYTANK